jgi:hypothetical protein
MRSVEARPGQTNDGIAIGILVLESNIPCIPGDVDNATTFVFPIRYEKIRGISMRDLLAHRTPEMLESIMRACNSLLSEGVKAITGDCGYLAYFQREVAKLMPVPVSLSSLMQVPFILNMMPTRALLGIIVADSRLIDEELLLNTGIQQRERLVIYGMENQPEFSQAMLGECGRLNPGKVQRELIHIGRRILDEHPSVGAVLIECSNLPPYSAALQEVLGIPVFDYVTMINYLYSAVVHTSFHGHL